MERSPQSVIIGQSRQGLPMKSNSSYHNHNYTMIQKEQLKPQYTQESYEYPHQSTSLIEPNSRASNTINAKSRSSQMSNKQPFQKGNNPYEQTMKIVGPGKSNQKSTFTLQPI